MVDKLKKLAGGRTKTRRKRTSSGTTTHEATVDDDTTRQQKKASKRETKVRTRQTDKTQMETVHPMPPTAPPTAAPTAPPKGREISAECEAAITHFVEMTCTLGVEALRKMFREQLATMCPPSNKCTAFEANPTRNRYADVVCLEESRVKLTLDVPPSTEYIHANWVKFAVHDRTFIATQGPMENTIEDFWRMVFQESCPIIVNLTKTIEDGKQKCTQYWPEQVGAYSTYGKMFINNKKIDDEDKFTLYTLEVLPEGCSNSHIVRMIHMQNWPDRGFPMHGLTVLRLLRVVATADKLATGPVVVHCSAGVGRTGTIILIDVILQRLFKFGINVDLVELFRELRLQRASCIQREGQFIFLISSIHDYIKARMAPKFKKECDKFSADFKASNLQSN